MTASYETPEVIDRRQSPYGEVVLRRHGALLQIIANGCFLMDTSDGRSERLLMDAAYDALDGRPEPSVLIGGLGVGFSLAHAAADRRWGRITVVERERAIIDWHRGGPLTALSAEALADPRADIVERTSSNTSMRSPTRSTPCASTSTTDPAGRSPKATRDCTVHPDWQAAQGR